MEFGTPGVTGPRPGSQKGGKMQPLPRDYCRLVQYTIECFEFYAFWCKNHLNIVELGTPSATGPHFGAKTVGILWSAGPLVSPGRGLATTRVAKCRPCQHFGTRCRTSAHFAARRRTAPHGGARRRKNVPPSCSIKNSVSEHRGNSDWKNTVFGDWL